MPVEMRRNLRRFSVVAGLAAFALAGCETLEDVDAGAPAATVATDTAAAAAPGSRSLSQQFYAGTAQFCADLMLDARTMADAVAIGDRAGYSGGLEDQSKAPMAEIDAVSVDLEGQKMFWTTVEGKQGQIQTFALLPSPVSRCRVALLDDLGAAEATLDMLRAQGSGWVAETSQPAPVNGIRSYLFFKLDDSGAVALNIAVPEERRPEYGRLVAMATVFRARPEEIPTQ